MLHALSAKDGIAQKARSVVLKSKLDEGSLEGV